MSLDVGINTKATQVEYIECSGLQGINTRLKNTGIHIVVDLELTAISGMSCIVGTHNTRRDKVILEVLVRSNGQLHSLFLGNIGSNRIIGPTLTANTRYLIEAKLFSGTQKLIVDNVEYGSESVVSEDYPDIDTYLCTYNKGNVADDGLKAKIYSAKFYDSTGTLIRDYVPVVDNAGVYGLWDKVQNTMNYNIGTGTITGGNEEPYEYENDICRKVTKIYAGVGGVDRKIVKGYIGVNGVARNFFRSIQPLNYIESAGMQYIDTGIKPSSTIEIECTQNSGGYSGSGSRIQGGDEYRWGTDSTNKLVINYGTSTYTSLVDVDNSKRYTYYVKNGMQKVVDELGNILINEADQTTISYVDYNITLSAIVIYMPGIPIDIDTRAVRIFSCKIYDNGVLVRDFVPVLLDYKTPCLYDKVTDTYFYNQGEGEFLYG